MESRGIQLNVESALNATRCEIHMNQGAEHTTHLDLAYNLLLRSIRVACVHNIDYVRLSPLIECNSRPQHALPSPSCVT